MINVKKSELKRGFSKHYACYKEINGHNISKRLLLFYAVECGLKYLMLIDLGKNTTNDLFSSHKYQILKNRGHDIREMIKLMGYEGVFKFHTIHATSDRHIEPSQYNQLWRYGIDVYNLDIEVATESLLISIAEWIVNRI